VEGGEGDELEAIVDEFFVDFVGEDDEVGVLDDDVGEGLEFFGGVGVSGGVGGGVEDEDLGLGGDGGLELMGGDFEGIFFLADDDFVDAAGEFDLFGVGDPVGGEEDGFVAGVEYGHEGHVEAVFSAGAGGDVFGLVGEVIFIVELFSDGGLEVREAGRGGVLGLALVEGDFGGVFDEGWCIEVGFAGAEADDVDAGFFHGVGLGGDGEGDGLGDELHAVGKADHG